MTSSKRLLSAVLTALILAVPAIRLFAQAAPAPAPAATQAPAAPVPTSGITAEFKVIFEQITTKLKAGQGTESELATDVAALDALLAKHASEKTEEVAMVALMMARLYLEVFENADKGVALLKDIKTSYPNSEIAKNIDQAVAAIEKQAAAASILAVGKTFPAFTEKDLNDKPLALENFKGKIVLIDFWATWCGPCVAELPNVLAAYEKFHAKGFEVVGISLDQSRDALTAFIKEKNMAWPQYFDGLGWKSKLGTQYGIQSIPATFLLDGEGKIIARDLRGPALDAKLASLLK